MRRPAISVGGRHAETVAVGVGERHFSPPRLLFGSLAELGCNQIYVVDPEIHERARSGVTGVFREMKLDVVAYALSLEVLS